MTKRDVSQQHVNVTLIHDDADDEFCSDDDETCFFEGDVAEDDGPIKLRIKRGPPRVCLYLRNNDFFHPLFIFSQIIPMVSCYQKYHNVNCLFSLERQTWRQQKTTKDHPK